jgi:oligopeptide transport system ATP-binding protein
MDKVINNSINTKDIALSVKDLAISFTTDQGIVKAVRGVSFDLYRGETLCIVGESGSGKSVTSKTIMGILSANAIIEHGSIMYQGEDLVRVSEEEFHRIRGHHIGMIFQDPLSSLNPIMRVGKQITEATMINRNILKRRFNDLIAPELVAMKNHSVNRNYEIENLNYQVEALKHDGEKEIEYQVKKDPSLSKEDKEALKKKLTVELNAKVKALRQENNLKIKEVNKKYHSEHPALVKALKVRSKSAKKEVDDYKKQLVLDLHKNIEEINKKEVEVRKRLIGANEIEQESIKKELAELRAQREALVTEFVNKTKITHAEARRQALEVMKEVGIPFPEKRYRQYPFEFSGGMRQRIVIAIALTANPEILICDEPTTALDVTIQAQILELINRLKKSRNMSCIFITHDLGVVANMADRVAVMYAGKIVEYGTVNEIFYDPQHPYTWALLSSIPDIDAKEKIDAIPGTPPNMIFPPRGDAFALRSKYAMKIDFEYEPPFFQVSPTHFAATWLLAEGAPKVEKPKIVTERIRKSLEEAKQNGKVE